MRFAPFLIFLFVALSCSSKNAATKVVKPKTHHIWAKGNKYLIDIPIGTRHLHLFERRRTKTVRMN